MSSGKHATVGFPAREGAAVTTAHWSPPDIAGDILATARQPGLTEPVAVHVRPELAALIADGRDGPTPTETGDLVVRSAGIPFVVDDEIPGFPGFEVHRAPPERS